MAVHLPRAITKSVEWDVGAQPRKPVSLSVALAGTEGQFQFSLMLIPVGLFACVHFWCVSVWVLLLGFFCCFFFFFFK